MNTITQFELMQIHDALQAAEIFIRQHTTLTPDRGGVFGGLQYGQELILNTLEKTHEIT